MASKKHLLVGAIDFGTTFSGWAYAFFDDFKRDPVKTHTRHWNSGTTITEKTPTCALISPDGKTLVAFGYDAENKYRQLAENDEHKKYYYFRRFKMALDKERLSRDLVIKDEMGKSLRAIDVFSMSISALVKDMLESSSSTKTGGIYKDDVHWVLTVPAIWSDGAKQFMKEAATKEPANIKPEKLSIALEPEAASIFCRHLSVDNVKGKNVISQLPVGTKYMILDAGGGTIDITVHQVGLFGGLKEVHAATGGGWGGMLVDETFKNLITDLVGKEVYEQFTKTETEDWLELWRNFEVKKKTIDPSNTDKVTMIICQSLRDLCQSEGRSKLSDLISSSKYSSEIQLKGDRIRIDSRLMQQLFSHSVNMTVSQVRSVLGHEQARDVEAILLVGGYSDSPMLQEAITREFGHLKIVIPNEASSAVLRGAVIFGHQPGVIQERVLRKTYGKETRKKFDPKVHDIKYRKVYDAGERCSKIFDRFAVKGQTVSAGETTREFRYTPLHHDQRRFLMEFYASDLNEPMYTDEGCQQIGTLEIDLRNVPGDLDRAVYVSLTFGDTELKATCRVEKTGQILNAKLDFLG